MENTYEIVTRIMEAYYDKEKENKSLFNKKQTETERINNEITINHDESARKLEYLKSKLERLEQEKTEPYISKSVFDDNTWYENKIEAEKLQDEIEKLQDEIEKLQDEIKLEDKNSEKSIENNKKVQELEFIMYPLKSKLERLKEYDEVSASDISSLNEKIEQEYQRRLSELNSRLDEISKKEKERDDLIKKIVYNRENKSYLKEEFVKQKNVVAWDPVADVIRANFDDDFMRNETKLLSKIIDFSKNKEKEEEQIKSEIERLKRDRYKEFGRTAPDTSVERKKYLYSKNNKHEEDLNAQLKEEYDKKKNEIIEEIKTVLKESEEKEKALKEELTHISTMPDFSKVYLKEMFDLKYQLTEMLRELKAQCVSNLKVKQDEKEKIINPISMKLNETKQIQEKISERLNELSPKLKDDYENIGAEMTALVKQLGEVTNELVELEHFRSKALLDTKPLDKLVDRLNQNIELINRAGSLLSVTDDEIKAYKTPFTAEEQEEYNRRQPAQRDKINSIMKFKKSQNDNNESIDNSELESMKKM